MIVDRYSSTDASRSDGADDGIDEGRHCTECGQLLNLHVLVRVGQADRHVWWPWVLVALGVYLLIFFGSRAAASIAVPSEDQGPATAGPALASAEGPSVVEAMRRGEAPRTPLESFAFGPSRPRRDLYVALLGGAMILVGLGSMLRRRFRRPPDRTLGGVEVSAPPPRPSRYARAALTAWALGEAAVLAILRVLLIVAVYLGSVAVLQGQPLS